MKGTVILLFFISLTAAEDLYIQEFKNGNVFLTSEIYKRLLGTQKDNFAASIFPLQVALACLQSGAKGLTAQQIRSSLHLLCNKNTNEWVVKTIYPLLVEDNSYVFDMADKIYVKQKFPIKQAFKKIVNDSYFSEAENIDFSRLDASQKINSWVQNKTHNKIDHLVDSSDFSRKTTILVVNSHFFQANWTHPFLIGNTRREFFYKSTRELVTVDMMSQWGNFYDYKESKVLDAKFLQMPFVNLNASIVFVLPNRIDGLAALERRLDYVFRLQKWVFHRVYVKLPFFFVKTKLRVDNILKQMGVKAAFDKNQADFSRISGKKGDLAVEGVVQKTIIRVNEGGVNTLSAPSSDFSIYLPGLIEEKRFVADHPFIFYVKVKGIIVFVGRVVAPHQ